MVRIAIVDYLIVPTNPIGGCHLKMITALKDECDFVVFACRFDNPDPARITFFRVPAIRRPLALLFVTFHVMFLVTYLLYRLRGGRRFDQIQVVESNAALGDISYAHFCHRAFLHQHWRSLGVTGLRGRARWLDHRLHALVEPLVFRRARSIVVASEGLAGELAATYPVETNGKVRVIANPVDIGRMSPPKDFDRVAFRRGLGLQPHDAAAVFVALGHFERKGLALLLDAFARVDQAGLKLVAVGGHEDALRPYRDHAAAAGLGERVIFVGMQTDVRPHLWAADVFVFPSAYETFSLVVHEAAAAALPLITTSVYGVEEFVRDGENGLLIERTVPGIAAGLLRFLDLSSASRNELGASARRSVGANSLVGFAEGWRALYREIAGIAGGRGIPPSVEPVSRLDRRGE